jgi:arginine/lysine/ornithine decarboxylase
MILGTSKPGDLFIVQRNVHKSIIHGLMLAGARAVLLPPFIDPISGLATVPSEALLDEALIRYADAKAIIVCTPNYYGMSSNLKPLVELAHKRGLPILVDEAHGPHFGFHPAFPISALQAGADVVVQSTHKMLSAMTMGAMLHMQGDRIHKPSVKQALRMIQSSSPSFPLMASLDLARQQLHNAGEAAFYSALEAVTLVANHLQETPFRALGYGLYANDELAYDPLKIVLFDESATLSGFQLRDELHRHNCVAEMADSRYVVMAFGTGSNQADGIALLSALAAITSQMNSRSSGQATIAFTDKLHARSNEVPKAVTFSREVSKGQSVKLENSVGLTAAEWIIPYPPGIPVLYPGETITLEIIEQLRQWRHQGAQIQGASDPELLIIQVQTL